MLDFTVIQEHFVLVVVVACLVIGYLIKHTFDFIPNKYIPAILAILGAVLNTIVSGVTVETITYGAVMGLASTGFHQVFKQWIENSQV